ncbi:MAG: hypothetical protein PF505_08435 [Vallitaleaceae bacterium]|jgi:hypothetical protein|nr:hypothetical protein [Vallitaleaceae bacterium]
MNNEKLVSKDWKAIFDRHQTFDGTNKEFCNQEQININSFYVKKRLFKSDSEPKLYQLVDEPIKTETCNPSEYSNQNIATPMELVINSGQVVIRVINPTESFVLNIVKGVR